jgi:hypothetical protein
MMHAHTSPSPLWWGVSRPAERKSFFSEEKKQKTFISGAFSPSGHGLNRGLCGELKVFLLLFLQKKKSLTLLAGH